MEEFGRALRNLGFESRDIERALIIPIPVNRFAPGSVARIEFDSELKRQKRLRRKERRKERKKFLVSLNKQYPKGFDSIAISSVRGNCVSCNSNSRLSVHHCVPLEVRVCGDPKLKVIACRSCHDRYHSKFSNSELRLLALQGIVPGSDRFERLLK